MKITQKPRKNSRDPTIQRMVVNGSTARLDTLVRLAALCREAQKSNSQCITLGHEEGKNSMRMLYFEIPARTCSPFVRKWRNWQTRKPQELVAARSWRFKSSLPHHFSIPPIKSASSESDLGVVVNE
jgi:hypothetical protein